MAKKKFSGKKTALFSLVGLVLGIVLGVSGSIGYSLVNVVNDEKRKTNISGKIYDDFQIHFMELGNIYAGDSIYIKAGDNDILIDAGSRDSSKNTIKNYVNQYCTDGKLEYVIATHAHQDHIASFGTSDGILYSYQVGTLIDFANHNSTSGTYNKYNTAVENLVSQGTKHYTALECTKEINGASKIYTLGENITMEVLYQKYYEETSSSENNYSVCLLFKVGEYKFLFTGDLEADGEKSLVDNNKDKIENCTVYKAGHHGSKTSSSDYLLDVVNPKISVCTCVCGSTEYTTKNENTFPTQQYVDRISKHTKEVYVTSLCVDYEKGEYQSMNGNIIISSNKNSLGVACSNNSTLLKDTEWFKTYRTTPESWL